MRPCKPRVKGDASSHEATDRQHVTPTPRVPRGIVPCIRHVQTLIAPHHQKQIHHRVHPRMRPNTALQAPTQLSTARFSLSRSIGGSSNTRVLKLDRALSGLTGGLSSQPKLGLSQPCSNFFGLDFGFDRVRDFDFVLMDCCCFFLSPMHMPSHDARLKREEICDASLSV